MKGEKKGNIDLDINVAKVILKACVSASYKLESLVKDYYNDKLSLTKNHHCLLMEFTAAATTLSILLDEYIFTAEENLLESLTVSNSDFNIIMQLAKTLEMAQRTKLGNICLWDH